MKIIQVMPKFGLAGAEIMCENLTYELKKKGHDVVIISLYNYYSAITDRLENNGVKIVYLGKKPGLDVSMITKIAKVLSDEKADVIHSHLYAMQYAVPAAIIKHIKVRVHTVHNVAQKENDKLARKFAKFFYRYCHVIPVALSDEIQDTIVEEYQLKKKFIPVAFNGIDIGKCIPKKTYELNNPIKILHIGRFSPQKNHKGLLEAFNIFHEKYPNSLLYLIGDGELLEETKELVGNKNLESSVIFLGLQEEVYRFLNEADIFILSSIYEGVPMSLIEAMGTGIPIIATDVGGVGDMLRSGENAILTDIDVSKISDALCQVVRNNELRINIGTNALKRANVFSSEKMAEKYLDIYSLKR